MVIPPGGEIRYQPVVDTHASFKPSVSGYLQSSQPTRSLEDVTGAALRELSKPGNGPQRPPERMRPVIPGGGRFKR